MDNYQNLHSTQDADSSDLFEESALLITPSAQESDVGKRADVFIAQVCELTRSALTRLMEQGRITLIDTEGQRGEAINKKYKVRLGDAFAIDLPDPQPCEATAENIPIDIVYEDDDIIVLNKPEGMVVHPAPGNNSGTLVNALMYHCVGRLSSIGGVIRPGIVHRIDKDTGGLLVVAKNDEAHLSLAQQIKQHKVERVYHAIVKGNFREDEGKIDLPIGRCPTDRKKMAVIRRDDLKSREAVTHWRVLERFGAFTHVECRLETGRTHQIRVHMSSQGHPLLGDPLYGGTGSTFESRHKDLICGQCLFAARLTLTHPKSGEAMSFSVPLPDNFEQILQILRKTVL